MKFSRVFTVKGSIERVFLQCERCFSDTKFIVKNRVQPTLLILERGNIAGSLSSFKIDEVKTVLTMSFSQNGEDVRVRCDYETLYGRLIIPSDEAILKEEVMKLKNCLQATLQK